MRVLVATDGSPSAKTAMNAACRILSPDDRCIDLMAVVPERRGTSGLSEKLERRAARILDSARRTLADQGISAQPRVEPGSPVRVLLRASLDYDVTVVGAKSREEGMSSGLGPVASRIVEHSAGSVLIGREGRSDPGLRILIPVDGSDAALGAIDKLVSLVDLSGAEVTLMHVVEVPWLSSPDEEQIEEEDLFDAQTQQTHEFERELEREAEETVEEARAHLPVRVAVNRVIERGLPAETILGEAESNDYDLVVAAASGSTDMKHQLLGSVSVKLAWNAPCSVLLVRYS